MEDYEASQIDFQWNHDENNDSHLFGVGEYPQNKYFLPQQEFFLPQYEKEIPNEFQNFEKQHQIYDAENPKPATTYKDFEQYSDESENLKYEDYQEFQGDENEVKQEFEYDEKKEKQNEDNKSTKIIIQMKQIRKQPKEELCKRKGVSAEQVETKNLAAFYARFIIKSIKRQDQVSIETLKTLQKFEKKVKTCTLKTLRDLLDDESIRQSAQKYFCNFEFLDDLLSSDKQQDIKTPIKYLNKMYQGCLNREKLNNWKEQ